MLPSGPQLKHFAPGPYSLHPSRNIARKLELCPLKFYLLWVPKVNSQHTLHTGQQVASRTRNPLQKGSCSVFQYLHKQQQATKFIYWKSKNCVQNQPYRRGITSRQEKQLEIMSFQIQRIIRKLPGTLQGVSQGAKLLGQIIMGHEQGK